MKSGYTVIDEQEQWLVINKEPSFSAGELIKQAQPIEKELYHQYKKQLYALYPMESGCSGLAIFSEQSQHKSLAVLLSNPETHFIYDIIVHNPIFFEKEYVKQPIQLQGKKYVIQPGGKEFVAEFELLTKYKDFSYIKVSTPYPFHQGVLLSASFLGSPVLGDGLYGIKQPLYLSMLKKKKYKPKDTQDEYPMMNRPAIHLREVKMSLGSWEAPFPKDFRSVIHNLNKFNRLAESAFLDEWLKNIGVEES